MNRSLHIIFRLAFALGCAGSIVIPGCATAFAATSGITVMDDGSLAQPANFWSANAPAIHAALGTSLYTPNTRLLSTAGSITGGGNLSADRTLQLVGDSASPGTWRYYGTAGGGSKGFHALPTGGGVTNFSALLDVATNQYGPGRPIVRQPDGRLGDTNTMTVGQLNASAISMGSTVVPTGNGGTGGTNVQMAQQNLLLVPGAHIQAFSPILQSISEITGVGILVKDGPDSFVVRDLSYGAGLTIDNPTGVGGSPTIRLTLSDPINGGVPNGSGADVAWSRITGMPPDVADGDSVGAFTWDVDVDADTASGASTAVYTNLISEGYTHQLRLFITAGGPTNQGSWQHNVVIGRSSAVTNFGAGLYSGLAVGSGVGMTSYCQQVGPSFVIFVRGITNENVHWSVVGSRITTTNGSPSGGGGQSYLVNEDWEGSGFPVGWTQIGSPSADHTTNAIAGAQDFYAPGTSDSAFYQFTAGTNLWVKARLRIDSLSTAFDFLSIRDTAGAATVAKLNVRTNGSVRVYQGTQFTASASGVVVAGTNTHLWLQYIPSTGANGIAHAYISANGTWPGTPTASVNIGDATATPGQIRLLGGPSVFDAVQVSEIFIP